jgi:hypothetical protein
MQNDIYKKIFKRKKPMINSFFSTSEEKELTEPNDVYLSVYDNKYYHIDPISKR